MLDSMNQILRKLSEDKQGSESIYHLSSLLQALTAIFFKEETLSDTLEKFKGFVEFFAEKWEELNGMMLKQNSFISNLFINNRLKAGMKRRKSSNVWKDLRLQEMRFIKLKSRNSKNDILCLFLRISHAGKQW